MSVVAPELFPTVDEYVDDWPSLSDSKKQLRRAHPLVVFAEAFLEQFSTNALGTPIVGLTETSREVLVRLRRELEAKGGLDAVRVLMFSLEELCSLVPGASYGGGDSADEDHFHRLRKPTRKDLIAATLRRPGWYLYVAIAVVLVAVSALAAGK